MSRQREITVLLVLLLGAMAFVLGYVIIKRSERTAAPTTTQTRGPLNPPTEVDLTQHDGQTLNFSSGQPVVQDTPADRAVLEADVREMRENASQVVFPGQPTK